MCASSHAEEVTTVHKDIWKVIQCKNGNCTDQFVVAAAFPSKWERYFFFLFLLLWFTWNDPVNKEIPNST